MQIDFSNFSADDYKNPTFFEAEVLDFINQWFDQSKTVQVQTSGSTGTPKIFDVEKKRMKSSAAMTCDFLALTKGNTTLLCLPVQYISGKMMVVRAIERSLILDIKTPAINPLKDLTHRIDFCAMSPLQVENSLDKLHLIKNLLVGGAAVSESLKLKIASTLDSAKNSEKPKTKIFETYGMSETLSHIALKEIYPDTAQYFKVLDGIKISLDDRGCLIIDAPNLNSEILITNDLIEIEKPINGNESNNEFKYLGRIDSVINSGGLKIHPEELENLLKKQISNELIFAGINDELLGQKLLLVIEGDENESIKEYLKNINYPSKNHVPKEIFFLKVFPRIANGKINRKQIVNSLQTYNKA